MRFERHSKSMESLREQVGHMATVVEHRRKKNGNGGQHPLAKAKTNRKLKECVAVMIWEEEDGTETVCVVGNPQITDLEVKGVLHDAVYAVAHVGEEGFNKVDL